MSQLGLVNPVSPGDITQAGMLACLSLAAGTFYPTTTKPVTSALATGFTQIGVLSSLPKMNLGREMEEVKTGIYGITQALLFKGIEASVDMEFYGLDPAFVSMAMGVTPVVTAGAVTTTTTAVVGVDSATGNSSLTVTANTGMTVGMMLQVCATAAESYSTNFGRVLSVSGSTGVVLDRILRDTSPASGAAVSQVLDVMIPIAGVNPVKFSFAALCDFPDGRVGAVLLPQVYPSKALQFGMGNGMEAVKIPVTMTALGTLDATYGVILGKLFIFS